MAVCLRQQRQQRLVRHPAALQVWLTGTAESQAQTCGTSVAIATAQISAWHCRNPILIDYHQQSIKLIDGINYKVQWPGKIIQILCTQIWQTSINADLFTGYACCLCRQRRKVLGQLIYFTGFLNTSACVGHSTLWYLQLVQRQNLHLWPTFISLLHDTLFLSATAWKLSRYIHEITSILTLWPQVLEVLMLPADHA